VTDMAPVARTEAAGSAEPKSQRAIRIWFCTRPGGFLYDEMARSSEKDRRAMFMAFALIGFYRGVTSMSLSASTRGLAATQGRNLTKRSAKNGVQRAIRVRVSVHPGIALYDAMVGLRARDRQAKLVNYAMAGYGSQTQSAPRSDPPTGPTSTRSPSLSDLSTPEPSAYTPFVVSDAEPYKL